MKKMKVYLDTSVISYLDQKDSPERMADTQALWKRFEEGEADIYLSPLTLEELDGCIGPKRGILLDFLERIDYTVLLVTEEAVDIAEQLIDMGILTRKSYIDCQHIGIAMAGGCDCILSWNFAHIVTVKTIHGVRAISLLSGYREIEIWSPSVVLHNGEEI